MSDAVRKDVLEIKDDAKCLVLSHPPYNQFGSKLNQLEAKNILGLNPDKKTLLFFGLIRDYKGLDILLEAFSRLPDEFQLIVAGEVYGSEQVYQNLIEKSQNKNIVFINNYIPDQEVTNYFSAADLCVLPYKSATQSGIKAIADSFQVPVLTTNVGGLAELITPNKNGFIIENVDPEPLSNQILNLFNTEALDSVKLNLESKTNMENDEWKVFAQSLLQFSEELKRIK
jgi:glycosyltransferase involved in cell wall biosynthesis